MKTILSLLLAGTIALTGCQMFKKHEKKDKPPAITENTMPDQSGEQDFQAFVGRLRQAVRAHDVNIVASMMTEDFGYRLEPEGVGAGVFKYWDEQGLWQELDGILSEKFVPKGQYMVAPPQFADPTVNYDGYRAGIRRVKGSWKFAYFVNG